MEGGEKDEMVECYHQLNGHESEKAPGVGGGQASLAYCTPLGHRELDILNDCTELRLWNKNTKEVFRRNTHVKG